MRSTQLMFLVILHSQMLISVLGQIPIGCFVPGECTNSLYLAETSTPLGELQCLEYCAKVEGSNYFTYEAGDDSYCVCLVNCNELSASECSDCSSGDTSCECFITNARVNGAFLSVDAATDANNCAEACNTDEDCRWFTYNSDDQSCVLTSDREFTSECSTCTYGHGGCRREGLSMFTCGGYYYSNDYFYVSDAEVIDLPSLDGSDPDRECNNVPDMPDGKYAHFAIWDRVDGSALCCGGYDDASSQLKRCYKYAGADWLDMGDVLIHERRASSAVELSDGRYWISGGEGPDAGETSEFYQDGAFLEGPQLPNPLNGHCAVEVEPGFVFVSGNEFSGYEKVTLRINPDTGANERLADMTQERSSHGCGVVDKGDSKDIVVAGGFYDGQILSETEIYNTGTGEWRAGRRLPQPLNSMASVPYGDTFLLVGGYSGRFLNTIYQYDPTTGDWILRPERLSGNRERVGAVIAGPPVADCS